MVIAGLFAAFYGFIGIIAHKHRMRIQAQIPECRMQNKGTKVLMTVVGTCLILWSPLVGYVIWDSIEEDIDLRLLSTYFLLPGMANHLLLYMKIEFRDTFLNLLPCRKQLVPIRNKTNTLHMCCHNIR